MNPRAFKDDSLLLLIVAILGFAFVAQRAGMEYVQPFTYNCVRFALGSLSLLPLIFLLGRSSRRLPAADGDRLHNGGQSRIHHRPVRCPGSTFRPAVETASIQFAVCSLLSLVVAAAAETVVLGGWLILAEGLPLRSLTGCVLMPAGMIVSQTSMLRNPAAVGSSVPRP